MNNCLTSPKDKVIASVSNDSKEFFITEEISPGYQANYDFHKLILKTIEKNNQIAFLAFNQNRNNSQDGYFAGANVAHSFRNKGLFSSLLYTCLEYFKLKNNTEIFLRTATIRKPQLALVLEKIGYSAVSRECLVKVLSSLNDQDIKIRPVFGDVSKNQYAENGKKFYDISDVSLLDCNSYPGVYLHTNYVLKNRKAFLQCCLKGRKNTKINFL